MQMRISWRGTLGRDCCHRYADMPLLKLKRSAPRTLSDEQYHLIHKQHVTSHDLMPFEWLPRQTAGPTPTAARYTCPMPVLRRAVFSKFKPLM